MTKQLTRQEIEAVVERLQTHECSPSCCVICDKRNILIGNVLENMQNVSCEHMDDDTFGIYCKKLCLLWEPLGFSRSLQEIILESGYQTLMDSDNKEVHQELVSPEANALFSFLLSLFPIPNE